MAKRLDINVIDPSINGISKNVYDKYGSVVYKYDGHYNNYGHIGQAEAITEGLSQFLSGR